MLARCCVRASLPARNARLNGQKCNPVGIKRFKWVVVQEHSRSGQFSFRTYRFRSSMSDALLQHVNTIVAKHDEIMKSLSEGGNRDGFDQSTSSSSSTSSLAKDLQVLAPVARLQQKMLLLDEEEQSIQELLEAASSAGDDDKDMEEECRIELTKIQSTRARLEKRLLGAILPSDEEDFDTNAVLEVRAGTGGDEAALFAAQLLEAYIKTAKGRGWKVEVLNKTETDIGGVKEASLSITGTNNGVSSRHGLTFDSDSEDLEEFDSLEGLGPYGFFKFESGVHRVQRVPINDVRIHTSACSVGVLPSPSDEHTEKLLPMSELNIETMRSSGAGGQSVNTTDSAVRITHIPTGITAAIQDERSQHKNKEKALKLIAARVLEVRREAAARERGEARNNLMGGGDRSERIRTYNFPQDRVTDHRCKVSEYGIVRLLGGSSEDGIVSIFAPPLRALTRDTLLQELLGNKSPHS